MSWEKARVADLRAALITKFQFTEEEAGAIKGKDNLIMQFIERGFDYEDIFSDSDSDEVLDVDLDEMPESEDKFDIQKALDGLSGSSTDEDVVVPDEEEVEQAEATIKHVRYGGPNWAEYVMSLFKASELDDEGNPKVHGLRRIAEDLLGDIVFSGPINQGVMFTHDGLPQAWVVYEVRFDFKLDLVNSGGAVQAFQENRLADFQYPQRVFRAMAGANAHNTPDDFAIYPEAMAETRAESRVFRKALLIDKVSSEELAGKSGRDVVHELKQRRLEKEGTSEYDENALMAHTQKSFIEKKTEQLGIDVGKLAAHVLDKDFGDKLTRKEAMTLIQEINSYQANHDDSNSIPEEIKS